MKQMTPGIVASSAAALLASAQPAQAHIIASRLGDFYAGAAHPITDLQDVLLWTAIALLAGSLGASKAKWLVLSFPSGLAAGFYSAPAFASLATPLANAIVIVALGLLIATHSRLPTAVLSALACLLAVASGTANAAGIGPDTNRLLFAAGLTTAGYAAITLAIALTIAFRWPTTENPPGWRSVALRAVGSWIAAIGLMMGALAVAS